MGPGRRYRSFFIALVPIYLVCSAALIDAPDGRAPVADYQLISTLIVERTPLVVQALGALVSAILSTAGGALAPGRGSPRA